MKLAIFSPNQNLYSETFIQAHRQLTDDTLYYYGGFIPRYLDGEGDLFHGWGKIRHYCFAFYLLCHPRLVFYPKQFRIEHRVLAESLHRNKVTHVLAEFGNCATEVMDLCDYLGIKLISHFHGYEISRFDVIHANQNKYVKLFEKSYKVIAVSRLMQNNLISMGCPKDKVLYCPCGPNDSLLFKSPNFSSNNILYVGRFVNKKAPHDLILAFKSVLDKVPDATLTMIGSGELKESCENLAKYLGIFQNVFFLGVVNHPKINQYFENASVYCQPSVTSEDGDQEGTPVSVMEASLSGLPVVATFHAGIPDVILNKETGLLVQEHDINALSQSLIDLLLNKDKAQKFGESGREFIKKNFMLSVSLEKIRNFILN